MAMRILIIIVTFIVIITRIAIVTLSTRAKRELKRKPRDIVEGEISYISEKMNKLPKNKRRTDLLTADSNFGMFEEDLETCKVIAKEQNKNNSLLNETFFLH